MQAFGGQRLEEQRARAEAESAVLRVLQELAELLIVVAHDTND